MSLAAAIERSQRDKEAWKYTSLKALAQTKFVPPAAGLKTGRRPHVPSIFAASFERHQMVFVNGVFRPDLSPLNGLPANILSGDAKTGYRLQLAGQTCLITAPLELVFLAEDIVQPAEIGVQLTVELGVSGRLTLIEHFPSAATDVPLVRANETTIHLAPQAKLVHGKIMGGGAASYLNRTQVDVASGAYYENFKLIKGGALVRNEIEVALAGEMAQCALNGVMLLRGQEHADTTTHIFHKAPHTMSRETYKSVAAGKSRGVFQGKVTVAPGAQKSDAQQMNRALLLSEQAEIDAKPELEIFADDVKCSHGCAVGDLDHESLFYLRTRGLSEEQARALLIEGFIGDLLDEIRLPEWRDFCRAQIEEWLNEQN